MSARPRFDGAAGARRRVRGATTPALIATALIATAVGSNDSARGAQLDGGLTVEPQAGPAIGGATMLGSAPQGTTGDRSEAWAIQTSSRAPAVGDSPLPFSPGQLALLRYTDATGWRFAQTPVDAGGKPYSGGRASEGQGRVTLRGGIALTTSDTDRGESPADRNTLMVADRGGTLRALDKPPADVLPSDSVEHLSLSVLTATDAGDRTRAHVAIEGPDRQRAVATWNGTAWSRESICVEDAAGAAPAGCTVGPETLAGSAAGLRVVSIAAAGERSWLLAQPIAATGRGLTLFERVGEDAAARWVLRSLGRPELDRSAGAIEGVSGMRALPSPWALTATEAGVWVDGRFNGGDITAFFDGQQNTAAWCDGPSTLCQHPLGLRFADPEFHRSFAWRGDATGTRVIAPIEQSQGTSDRPPEAFATLEGTSFVRRETFNPRPRRGTTFGAPDEGWVGLTHVSRKAEPVTRAVWPIPVRQPLTAIVGAPGRIPGDIDAQALAVGVDGTVLRYTPGQGWDSEPLLGSSGVSRAELRGVAWPTPGFAFAVGDAGAMWRWDRVTGLWEPDPGAPFDFQGHLTGVAFQPSNPNRGYAVGRAGVLLRYDKTWTPEPLPAEIRSSGPLGGPEDLMSVAFAGSQALVASGRHLLVNDGGGWQVDASAQARLDEVGGASIYAVAGLPDGGAIAAGDNIVLLREDAASPWRFADQPLPSQVVTAVAAIRDNGQLRAVAAISLSNPSTPSWPDSSDLVLEPTDPGRPPPIAPPFSLPQDGTVMRQTATGWRDEEHALERSSTEDGAPKTDPTTAMLLDPAGRGWLVGGWTGQSDFLTRGSASQTASVARYAPNDPEPAPGLRPSTVATPPGPLRLLVGGHAQCEAACATQAPLDLMPDRTLARAARQAAALAAQPSGPRALLYTGGRVPVDPADAPQPQAEADRLVALLGGTEGALPVFATPAPGDETGGTGAAFQRAFDGAPAPFGHAAAAAGATPVQLGAAPKDGLARTHYAVDVEQGEGRVRVIVIDNARGSLAASDLLASRNPDEPQLPWLVQVLDDAKQKRIPAVVMGNRSLNPADGAQAASDASDVAALLRDNGASAYLYDSPERQVASTIPAGENGIPAFGSGTLGYGQTGDRGFSAPALLMLELDTTRRDATSNRAPIATRLIPVIEDLALEAIDGRVLNRSRPALFRALGRRPRSGDRWFEGPTSDPYVALPLPTCAGTGCPGRIEPEVRFTSSDPDIANFVRTDPKSTNPRKPFVDAATDKPVADAASGLLCAFNAGTTTISVAAGGLTYSTTLTVRGGSVLRPCGTVPLNPARFTARPAAAPVAPAPAPPAAQPQPTPPAAVPAPVAVPVLPPAPVNQPAATPSVVPPAATPNPTIATVLPPPSLSPRPIPPSGTSPVSSPTSVTQPATKVEKEREEELAPEQQQSAVRYVDGSGNTLPPSAVLALLLAAGMLGAGVRSRAHKNGRGEKLAMSYAPTAQSSTDHTTRSTQ